MCYMKSMMQGWVRGRTGQNFCVFSIQSLYTIHKTQANCEKATNFGSYYYDIETQATVPSLKHTLRVKKVLGGTDM